MKLRGLYAITPEAADADTLLRQVRAGARGRHRAAAVPQQEAARASRAKRKTLARAVPRAAACRSSSTTTSSSRSSSAPTACTWAATTATSPRRARSSPGKLLGVSCYDSLDAARAAVAAGADYVAFGSVFPSPTKPAAVRAPLALFGEARALGVPLVAIGGITLENAPQLLARRRRLRWR